MAAQLVALSSRRRERARKAKVFAQPAEVYVLGVVRRAPLTDAQLKKMLKAKAEAERADAALTSRTTRIWAEINIYRGEDGGYWVGVEDYYDWDESYEVFCKHPRAVKLIHWRLAKKMRGQRIGVNIHTGDGREVFGLPAEDAV